MAFWSPVSNLVAFGAMGIPCQAVCSASWVLLCAIGAVLGGCRWCATITIVTGVGCLMLVMVDCIHRFGAVGDLFSSMLNGEVVHGDVSYLTRRCLEWFFHKFAKELSFVAVCRDDMAMQLVLSVLIINHLAVVHQCLDPCNKILGVLSQPGHNILKFSEVHMCVDIMCHSLLDSVKEGRSFHLGHSPFLFAASRHPLHMHLQAFGSQGCKNVSEVVFAVRCDAVEEKPVLQGMPKDGERVVCIF